MPTRFSPTEPEWSTLEQQDNFLAADADAIPAKEEVAVAHDSGKIYSGAPEVPAGEATTNHNLLGARSSSCSTCTHCRKEMGNNMKPAGGDVASAAKRLSSARAPHHSRHSQRAQLRVNAAVIHSPKEADFMAYLYNAFFFKRCSIAVVVLKAVVESCAEVAELYRDVMAPYHNSLHAFFDRHSEDYYIWNYTPEDIHQHNLSPYFKTDETRVASRRCLDGMVVDRDVIFCADNVVAVELRKEENDVLQALLDCLGSENNDKSCPRRELLEELRLRFPNAKAPGGILSSANSFNRLVLRHPTVIGCNATHLCRKDVITTTLSSVKLPPSSTDTDSSPPSLASVQGTEEVEPVSPIVASTTEAPISEQGPHTTTWHVLAAAEYFTFSKTVIQ